MISILHKTFLENVLNNINTKYKDQLILSEDKIFTYSNIFNMPLYYDLQTFRKNADYGLYLKLQRNNTLETIHLMMEQILENNYNPNLTLLLYSYISNIFLNEALDEYIDNILSNKKRVSKKREMYLRSKIASSLQTHLYFKKHNASISKYEIKNTPIEDEIITLLNTTFTKIHYFSFGKNVFEISYKNFQKIIKQKNSLFNGLFKITAKIKDAFSFSKKYSLYSALHNYKVNEKYNTFNDISFEVIFDETIKKATTLIELISEEIYYKKKNEKLIENLLKK